MSGIFLSQHADKVLFYRIPRMDIGWKSKISSHEFAQFESKLIPVSFTDVSDFPEEKMDILSRKLNGRAASELKTE